VIYGMHDVYHDSGAQSPEQMEASKLQRGQAQGPAAVPFRSINPDPVAEHRLLADEESWRAAV
jgi:hypothetical protein